MSQYAYIPATRINDLQLNYSIASPSTWTFEKDGQQYGGIEEVFLTPQQKNEITSLGGQWFESAAAFNQWLDDSNDPLTQVIRDRQFGQELLNDYLAQNKSMTLTTQQSIDQLTKFGSVKQLLEAGAIRASLDVISAVTIDDIFTQVRKTYFVTKINGYLNGL